MLPWLTLRIKAIGLPALITRLTRIKAEMIPAVETAAIRVGQQTVDHLAAASPKGGRGISPPGDAQGHLDSSFQMWVSGTEFSLRVVVKSTMPTKLGYVCFGTGIYGMRGARIVPTTKGALYWEGAAHPVASVRGQHPNNFVDPIATAMALQAQSDMVKAAEAVVVGV